jgi:omega-hydroxy-beta-dihydromenaquinone-9 sulfotransferase
MLGEHPQVHALEWESRFLVDPGGFEDLARALTVAYTSYHADDALGRLAWLLNVRLTGHSKVFRGWGLAEELGIERYRAAVGRLWQQLAWYEFDEVVPPLGYRSGLDHCPGEPRVRRRVVARYFPDRAELTGILREFTAGLFGAAAEAAGKRTWCEKTPFNLLSVPFLLELFPEAAVVVIMRDPVHVAASPLGQPWAPSTLEGVLGWLEPVYRRWLAQRPALLQDRRYVEVKAETLAANWPDSKRDLLGRLGLPDADTVNTFAASRLAARRGQLSDTEHAEVVSRLGWAAGELGYPAPVWPLAGAVQGSGWIDRPAEDTFSAKTDAEVRLTSKEGK